MNVKRLTNNAKRSLNIALVYDKANTYGGAERILETLHQLFPQAPLYTSVHHPNKASWTKIFPQVIPSFLQKLPGAQNNVQLYAPFMPIAFESFNFAHYDAVISVTSGEAKGILTTPQTKHLCYCLTPPRYLWSDPGYAGYQNFGILNRLAHLLKIPLLHYLRLWDFSAAQRPDAIATISITSQKRIQKYYKKSSQLIYPGIDTKTFSPDTKEAQLPYFLVVSRLVAYKKVDLAIKACQQLNLPLKIIGAGPQTQELQKLITDDNQIELLGKVSHQQLLHHYQHCQALIMPQHEDFGLVALEAQACGRPVIAFNRGGASETIVHNKTGILFEQQTIESLCQALKNFQTKKLKSQDCRKQALKFSQKKFKTQFLDWIKEETRSS